MRASLAFSVPPGGGVCCHDPPGSKRISPACGFMTSYFRSLLQLREHSLFRVWFRAAEFQQSILVSSQALKITTHKHKTNTKETVVFAIATLHCFSHCLALFQPRILGIVSVPGLPSLCPTSLLRAPAALQLVRRRWRPVWPIGERSVAEPKNFLAAHAGVHPEVVPAAPAVDVAVVGADLTKVAATT